MVSEEVRYLIFNTYRKCKLIFCGDIGYQADPIEGSLMDTTAFQHIKTMNINYRCEDVKLDEILNKLRFAIENKDKHITDILLPIQTINKKDLVAKYDIHDMILTHTLKTQDEYNKISGIYRCY